MAIIRKFCALWAHKATPAVLEDTTVAEYELLVEKSQLDERMALRRERLLETIKETLNSMFIDAHDYRTQVMRTDVRGHRYVVMIDMTADFIAAEQGQHEQLVEIAAALTKNAKSRDRLSVRGVYWRFDETLKTSAADGARYSPPSIPNATRQPIEVDSRGFERTAAARLDGFETTWHSLSSLGVDNKTYCRDIARLNNGRTNKR